MENGFKSVDTKLSQMSNGRRLHFIDSKSGTKQPNLQSYWQKEEIINKNEKRNFLNHSIVVFKVFIPQDILTFCCSGLCGRTQAVLAWWC